MTPQATFPIPPETITGLVLAGGQGLRMGGADKGLEGFCGAPLALHALQRLRPQVGALAINANRNLSRYQALAAPLGAALWPDTLADYPGPLAGLAAGLQHCSTPWLLTVPCDTPWFPLDLAARLAHAAQQQAAPIAIAAAPDEDGQRQEQPVFCLLHQSCLPSLQAFLAQGGRKVRAWMRLHSYAAADFASGAAFGNANTLEQLRALEGLSQGPGQ